MGDYFTLFLPDRTSVMPATVAGMSPGASHARGAKTIDNSSLFLNGSPLQSYAPVNLNYQSSPTNFFFSGLNPGGISPQSSYAFFTNHWATNPPGYYTFEARITDTYGYTNRCLA